MNHTARVFRTTKEIIALPPGHRYEEALSDKLHEAFAEMEREVIAEVNRACQQVIEEAEAALEPMVESDLPRQKRRATLEGKAIGARAVAGILNEAFSGGGHADDQNQETEPQGAHLARPQGAG